MNPKQEAFNGGINLLQDETRLADNEYVWLFNGRTRFGYVEPINGPLLIVGSPDGNKQGLYGFGDLIILFCNGQAFYKFPTELTWNQVPDLQMDEEVDLIYAVAVPASTTNFNRKLTQNTEVVQEVVLVSGTPAALIVQDGINQPWLIFPDGTARKAQNYDQWERDGTREYVPIGKQMMFFNAKLYIVDPESKSIYHSVSGRPLDFMVNVDSLGNKLPDEALGSARNLSIAVDNDAITAIGALNAEAFLVATARMVYLVTPDYERKIFNEPTFPITPMFQSGIVNQYSLVELLGDFAAIDFEGIKSFNAVAQLRNEGRYSPLSVKVSPLFEKVVQDVCCATAFDNYALFAVKTNLGYVVLVYDMLLGVFVSVDSTEAIKIKQFATTYNSGEQRLYCIAGENVYQYYGSADFLQPILRTKAWTNEDITLEQKPHLLHVAMSDAQTDGTITAFEMVDRQKGIQKAKVVQQSLSGVNYPVEPPVFPSNKDRSQTITFNFESSRAGFKIAYIISWTNDARLTHIQLQTIDIGGAQSQQQQSRTYG